MFKSEGTPTPQIRRWGHQNTIIYLSGTANRTADGLLDFNKAEQSDFTPLAPSIHLMHQEEPKKVGTLYQARSGL
jgi:hypothetical protein